jgi:hypothetical protein
MRPDEESGLWSVKVKKKADLTSLTTGHLALFTTGEK